MQRAILWMTVLYMGCGLDCARAQTAGGPRTALEAKVEVAGENVWLSDLLPSGAPAELRLRACQISLGRSPLPGSARILERADLARRIEAQGETTDGLAIPAQIRVFRAMRRIDPEWLRASISSYLERNGWARSEIPNGTQFESSASAAGSGNPSLGVKAMEWDAARSLWRFELRCDDPAVCGPFLVWAALPQRQASVTKPARPTTQEKIDAPAVIHAGERATLVLEQGNMRMSLPVISLEPGACQQQVRVRDLKGRRVFIAAVVGEKRLRAVY